MSTSIIARTGNPPTESPYFGPSPIDAPARAALLTPEGTTDLAGDFNQSALYEDPEFHLLEETYSTGEVRYSVLSIMVKPEHPVHDAEIGDEWSFVLDGHRTPTYRYMGLHKVVNVWLDARTLATKRIIAAVESAEVAAL